MPKQRQIVAYSDISEASISSDDDEVFDVHKSEGDSDTRATSVEDFDVDDDDFDVEIDFEDQS